MIFKRRKLENQRKQEKQEKFTNEKSNSLQEIEIDNISTTQGFLLFFWQVNKKDKDQKRTKIK